MKIITNMSDLKVAKDAIDSVSYLTESIDKVDMAKFIEVVKAAIANGVENGYSCILNSHQFRPVNDKKIHCVGINCVSCPSYHENAIKIYEELCHDKGS